MFHNLLSEDVYIDTASKSLEQCKKKASSLYKEEYYQFENNDNTCFEFCLFEVNQTIKWN